MVKSLPSYAFIYIIVIIVAICLQLCLSTSLIPKGMYIYKRVKALRVSLWVILIGILCYLFFRWTGDRLFSLLFAIAPEYKLLTIAAMLIAVGLHIYLHTTLLPKAINLYRTVKGLRVTLQLALIGILCFLFFYWTGGDKFISIFFFIATEYKHLTIAVIIAFFVFVFVQKKSRYELLDVFGSVVLICWLWAFAITASVHFIIHFGLIGKGVRLFDYLTEVIPANYKILPYIILVIWVINVYVLIDITIRRTSKIISEYMERKIRESYQEKIIELTYSDEYENGLPAVEQAYFKKVKRLFFTRNIFADELLRMHEIVYGVLHKRIHTFFDLLLLPNDAHNYLHNRHWYYKIKGLRIYSQLGNTTEIDYIRRLVSSKNSVLRAEAQLAMARLTEGKKPLLYLKDLEQRLTVWEQLNLIHYFTNFQKPVGDLACILASGNNSVVTFGLHCIRLFNRFEYREQILELTRHADSGVQEAAFEALTLHGDPEVVRYIISRYDPKLPLSTRLSIIKALETIGDPAAVLFLKSEFALGAEDLISIALFKALIRIDPQGASEVTASDSSGEFLRIYNHVIDLKI